MARRKKEDRNTRTLMSLAGGRSLATTLPIETLRVWGWEPGQLIKLTFDDKTHCITIEALKRPQ